MKNSKHELDIKLKIVLLASISICLLALLVLRYFFLTDKNWLSFWASFVGSVLAAVTTYIAFYFTYQMNNEQNRVTQNRIDEQARILIQPFINIEISPDLPESDVNSLLTNTIFIELTEKTCLASDVFLISNLGQATAVNVKVFVLKESSSGIISAGNMAKGSSVKIQINVHGKEETKYILIIEFEDLQGRKYEQRAQLILMTLGSRTPLYHAYITNLTSPCLKI